MNTAATLERADSRAASKQTHSVVSLFAGCGGLDLGFLGGFRVFGRNYERNPFEIVWANDKSEAACATYRQNVGADVRCDDIWKVLDTLPKRADVVIGGFPCQDISINGLRKGVTGERSGLYKALVRVIERTKPKVFVAENVKGLLMEYNKNSLRKILADFEGLGYTVSYALYLAADYGVPQMRERVFIVGTAEGVTPFVKPMPTREKATWMTAEEAISDLETRKEDKGFSHTWSRAEKSAEQGNRKLKADRPAHTIRAECHGNIQYHYKLPRRLSMREAARIQSFPDKFLFASKLRETERQVGNAVPPVMGWHIARAVSACLR